MQRYNTLAIYLVDHSTRNRLAFPAFQCEHVSALLTFTRKTDSSHFTLFVQLLLNQGSPHFRCGTFINNNNIFHVFIFTFLLRRYT